MDPFILSRMENITDITDLSENVSSSLSHHFLQFKSVAILLIEQKPCKSVEFMLNAVYDNSVSSSI